MMRSCGAKCLASLKLANSSFKIPLPENGIGRVLGIRRVSTGESPARNLALQLAAITDESSAGDSTAMNLATELAGIVQESDRRKTRSRLEEKKAVERRIKKRVKERFLNGKFHDLFSSVIANKDTLQDAYTSLALNSNLQRATDVDFDSLAQSLRAGTFNVAHNTFSLSSKSRNKQTLILPNLHLTVIQEAIRIVLQLIYVPHFNRISHGCRAGRGHATAAKFVLKKVHSANWWFSFIFEGKLTPPILSNIFATLENDVVDCKLHDFMRSMLNAGVINLEFGGFPKGHGLPQEGILSPILLNIYLTSFDRQFYKLAFKYEADISGGVENDDPRRSRLRAWIRNGTVSRFAVHCCRVMDEVFVLIRGSKVTAVTFKEEMECYVKSNLLLQVGNGGISLSPCDGEVLFFGSVLRARNHPVRMAHKLVDKVSAFAEQRQEAWDYGTFRIGKQWLAHGLKKVRESETKHFANRNPTLTQISRFRKPGMRTDHWYKALLKVWMEETEGKEAPSEENLLSFVGESALPSDLYAAYQEFQNQARAFIQSETIKTIHLLPPAPSDKSIFRVFAPDVVMRRILSRYGLVTSKGNSCMIPHLILQDHDQIIAWYSGIVLRWRRWYQSYEDFNKIEFDLGNEVRKSCIRTLAVKYKVPEIVIEKKFDNELCEITSGRDLDPENEFESGESCGSEMDEGLLYGIYYSGQCLLSLARIVSESRTCICFVIGCSERAPCVYTLHVMERKRYPFWKAGFSARINPCFNKRNIALCKLHLTDLYLGNISLQCIDFGRNQRHLQSPPHP